MHKVEDITLLHSNSTVLCMFIQSVQSTNAKCSRFSLYNLLKYIQQGRTMNHLWNLFNPLHFFTCKTIQSKRYQILRIILLYANKYQTYIIILCSFHVVSANLGKRLFRRIFLFFFFHFHVVFVAIIEPLFGFSSTIYKSKIKWKKQLPKNSSNPS